MAGFISDSSLARDLIRIGDQAVAGEDDAALRAYFTEDYAFHGPGGDLSFDQLRAYFASLRDAFIDLRIVREQIIVDGNFLAARTTFSGDFNGAFTYSPIGPVEPTGEHLEWEVIGNLQVRRRRATGRGVGADRLPQLPDQARRHHNGVRRAGEVVAVVGSVPPAVARSLGVSTSSAGLLVTSDVRASIRLRNSTMGVRRLGGERFDLAVSRVSR